MTNKIKRLISILLVTVLFLLTIQPAFATGNKRKMAAIRTMKRFDKQKEPAALSFSKAAGSKWARGYVCYTTAFFLLPSCGRCFYFLFFCATWTIMATKIIAAIIPIKGSHVSVMLCNTAFQFIFSGNIV